MLQSHLFTLTNIFNRFSFLLDRFCILATDLSYILLWVLLYSYQRKDRRGQYLFYYSTLLKKRLQHKCFPAKFTIYEIFKNAYFEEHLRTTASESLQMLPIMVIIYHDHQLFKIEKKPVYSFLLKGLRLVRKQENIFMVLSDIYMEMLRKRAEGWFKLLKQR